MKDNVVELDVVSTLDLPPERILEAAKENVAGGVVVVGYDADGEFYFASSFANGAEVIWLTEMAKKRLLEIGDGGAQQ